MKKAVEENSFETLTAKLENLKAPLKSTWFAQHLYIAMYEAKLTGEEGDELLRRLRQTLEDKGWINFVESHADYATNLATPPGYFIFEDMYKLVLTLQEIGVLEEFTFRLDERKKKQLIFAVKESFLSQPPLAKYTLALTLESWDEYWWYRKIL